MKKTFNKRNSAHMNELISIVQPMIQTLGVGAVTIILRRFGVPSKMIYMLVSAAIVKK